MINSLAQQFFQMFNSNILVREAWKTEVGLSEKNGPISDARIKQILQNPEWSGQVKKLGEELRPIIISQLKLLCSDALARQTFLKIIDEIDANGPLSNEDFELIAKGQLPERMKQHVTDLMPYMNKASS